MPIIPGTYCPTCKTGDSVHSYISGWQCIADGCDAEWDDWDAYSAACDEEDAGSQEENENSSCTIDDAVFNAAHHSNFNALTLTAEECNEYILNQYKFENKIIGGVVGVFTGTIPVLDESDEAVNTWLGATTNISFLYYTTKYNPGTDIGWESCTEYFNDIVLKAYNLWVKSNSGTYAEFCLFLAFHYGGVGTTITTLPFQVPVTETKPRPIWVFTGAGAIGSGTGTAATPLPFVAGGPWGTTKFEGKAFRLKPVMEAGFVPGTRPGVGGAIESFPHRYATLHVVNIDGDVIFTTTDFALQSIQKKVGEKFKVISTFDGDHLSFQANKNNVYQLGFKMINSSNFDWLRKFQSNWEKIFRGGVLAKDQARLYILYSGTLIGGYPLNMSISEQSQSEPMASMAITMYITDDVALPKMNVISSEKGVYNWHGESIGYDSKDNVNHMPPGEKEGPVSPI